MTGTKKHKIDKGLRTKARKNSPKTCAWEEEVVGWFRLFEGKSAKVQKGKETADAACSSDHQD